MSPRKQVGNSVDSEIVYLVEQIRKEEQDEETSMKDEIDAVNKWCSSLPDAHQTRIAHIAFKFRRRISSTICFLVAA